MSFEAEVRRQINAHNRALQLAEQMLSLEHGIKHQPGESTLCPRCTAAAASPSPFPLPPSQAQPR